MRQARTALVLVFFVLLAYSALPAAAQPARAAEPEAGRRWTELWQSFIAPFTVLVGEGRAIWDPNGGGDSSESISPTEAETADGRAIWDPNGHLSS